MSSKDLSTSGVNSPSRGGSAGAVGGSSSSTSVGSTLLDRLYSGGGGTTVFHKITSLKTTDSRPEASNSSGDVNKRRKLDANKNIASENGTIQSENPNDYTPLVPPRFFIHRTKDKFHDLEKIGEGTFGKVYKATYNPGNGQDKRVVALKQIFEKKYSSSAQPSISNATAVAYPANANNASLFSLPSIREVSFLTSFRHENVLELMGIVSMERAGEIQEYFVLDYIDHDLSGLFQFHPSLPYSIEHLKCISKQLIDGLNFMHSKGIVHRDIKGGNLLLTSKGVVKIADFGFARKLSPEIELYAAEKRQMWSSRIRRCLSTGKSLTSIIDEDLTNVNENDGSVSAEIEEISYFYNLDMLDYTNRVCTIFYRPLEVLLGSTRYGPEIDMWAVGCIIAEMFIGTPLFGTRSGSEPDTVVKVLTTVGKPIEPEWRLWEGQSNNWASFFRPWESGDDNSDAKDNSTEHLKVPKLNESDKKQIIESLTGNKVGGKLTFPLKESEIRSRISSLDTVDDMVLLLNDLLTPDVNLILSSPTLSRLTIKQLSKRGLEGSLIKGKWTSFTHDIECARAIVDAIHAVRVCCIRSRLLHYCKNKGSKMDTLPIDSSSTTNGSSSTDVAKLPLAIDSYVVKNNGNVALVDLIASLLCYNPALRPTASETLNHEFFTSEHPPTADVFSMPLVVGSWHEFECKRAARGGVNTTNTTTVQQKQDQEEQRQSKSKPSSVQPSTIEQSQQRKDGTGDGQQGSKHNNRNPSTSQGRNGYNNSDKNQRGSGRGRGNRPYQRR